MLSSDWSSTAANRKSAVHLSRCLDKLGSGSRPDIAKGVCGRLESLLHFFCSCLKLGEIFLNSCKLCKTAYVKKRRRGAEFAGFYKQTLDLGRQKNVREIFRILAAVSAADIFHCDFN